MHEMKLIFTLEKFWQYNIMHMYVAYLYVDVTQNPLWNEQELHIELLVYPSVRLYNIVHLILLFRLCLLDVMDYIHTYIYVRTWEDCRLGKKLPYNGLFSKEFYF